MKNVIKALEKSKTVFLSTHIEPDGDALGSLIAMGLLLENLGKNVTLYNESPIPAVYRFLPSSNRITHKLNGQKAYDTAIIMDCGSLRRIGSHAETFVNRIPVIVNIDHHVTNDNFGTIQFVDTDSCATAAIIYRLIKVIDAPITKAIAFSIYTGILTDTGSFRFSNTNRDSFGICAELVSLGVKPNIVSENVYGTYSLGRIKLLNLALETIDISKNSKLSMMSITEAMLDNTDTQPEDVAGFINYAKSIQNIVVAVLIFEYPIGNTPIHSSGQRMYHISLRSDGNVDVGKIAATFNGGGHASAAGFDIKSTLPELKKLIMNLAGRL